MTSLPAFLAAARADIGYREQPTNRTKFAAEAGHANGYAWCATWTSAIAQRVGLVLPAGVKETAYTPSAVNAWKKAGRWHKVPQPGDFVYFQFDKDPQVDHVGIVEHVNTDGTITTIEGNTSPDNRGSQSHGGGVYRRTRPLRLCVGFGRPEFQGEEVTDAEIEKIAQRVFEKISGPPLFSKRFTLEALARWTAELAKKP